VIYSAFAIFSFKELVILDNWLYSLSLLVELAAFLALRRREPGLARPWRVPGGQAGALIAVAFPSALALLAMATAGLLNTGVAVAVALTGPLAYLWISRASGSRR
jgi:amino acid transporter